MKNPVRYYNISIAFLLMTAVNVQSIAQEAAIDIEIPSNKAVIKGTLLTPDKNKKLPVVIIVPGSGRQVRKDFEGMVKFLFSGLDIAAFIYDKRGLGESTGIFKAPVAKTSKKLFRQRAKDVAAIVKTLRNSPYIAPDKIGLLGSSQGAWIITMVAGKDKEIAFIVSVSGAASSVGVSDYYDDIAEKEPSIEMAIAKLKDYKGVQGFDPYSSIKNMECPALWIYGGQDKSNPTDWDISIINGIKKKYSKEFHINLYPDYDHELIDTSTGKLGDKFVPDLRNWITNIVKE
ncbi:MAG TPA: prolyl oligopeptidase family serine peptidase [Chitinophagaceae bacterium]|nr:prolyl oligopeptidase family serine peptidase [Chitinophagaceae bacterium]MCB9056595.1 prolyl oligopeptidase family serine peptidase [Chitinophagales bacterium]HPG12809.1 prolyl oligopeptidase family serine peptidase [Chitinophagaceae bacterium]